jgi:enoyl-CoA hydratase/carnithine racemase
VARERESFGAGELHGMHKLLLKLQGLRVPVIAAINGTAMGGGCELALACDFRYMARGGQIGLPEVRVGILPGAGGTQRMTRLLGVAKATELMLLGNTLDADAAERAGLVHRALDADQLMPAVLALAAELSKRPPLSIALIKQCILQGSEMPLLDALRFEQDAFWQTMRSEDAARLMRAYLKSERPLNEQ